MKTYKITFLNESVKTMCVFDDAINPINEVEKWGDAEYSPANMVSVEVMDE